MDKNKIRVLEVSEILQPQKLFSKLQTVYLVQFKCKTNK